MFAVTEDLIIRTEVNSVAQGVIEDKSTSLNKKERNLCFLGTA
jgi:hypothetical protein